MNTIELSPTDRALIANLTKELRRFNDAEKVEVLYTYKEAAHYASVCYKTIRNWVSNGMLTPRVVGHSPRVAKAELDKVLGRC